MASLVPFWTVEDEAGNDRISALAALSYLPGWRQLFGQYLTFNV
jgi:hypothetical protein